MWKDLLADVVVKRPTPLRTGVFSKLMAGLTENSDREGDGPTAVVESLEMGRLLLEAWKDSSVMARGLPTGSSKLSADGGVRQLI